MPGRVTYPCNPPAWGSKERQALGAPWPVAEVVSSAREPSPGSETAGYRGIIPGFWSRTCGCMHTQHGEIHPGHQGKGRAASCLVPSDVSIPWVCLCWTRFWPMTRESRQLLMPLKVEKRSGQLTLSSTQPTCVGKENRSLADFGLTLRRR